MTEEWKWINGFEGRYQISNQGRIKSFLANSNGYVLNIKNSRGWYLGTILKGHDNRYESKRIHVLVAEHFIGNIPEGYQVHHIDGNKQNNTVENLEIVSTPEHRIKTMLMNPGSISGMNNYNKYERPRAIQQYTLDGQFIAEYANGAIASMYTGVCQRNILQVANHTEYKQGKVRRQAGGFVWKFKE